MGFVGLHDDHFFRAMSFLSAKLCVDVDIMQRETQQIGGEDQEEGDQMEKERIAILKAEIEAQVGEIEKIYVRIDERSKKKGKAAAESIGYQLHNLYCAFEDLFEIVAKTFENNIHDQCRYHLELLKRMTIAIEGIRPSMLSQEVFVLLDNLRSFRHFSDMPIPMIWMREKLGLFFQTPLNSETSIKKMSKLFGAVSKSLL